MSFVNMRSDPLLGTLLNIESICQSTLLDYSYSLTTEDEDLLSSIQILRNSSTINNDYQLISNRIADIASRIVLKTPDNFRLLKPNMYELINSVLEICRLFENACLYDDKSNSAVQNQDLWEKECLLLRNNITSLEKQSKIDTEALVKYQVKSLEYDLIFDEKEVLAQELHETYAKMTNLQNSYAKSEENLNNKIKELEESLATFQQVRSELNDSVKEKHDALAQNSVTESKFNLLLQKSMDLEVENKSMVEKLSSAESKLAILEEENKDFEFIESALAVAVKVKAEAEKRIINLEEDLHSSLTEITIIKDQLISKDDEIKVLKDQNELLMSEINNMIIKSNQDIANRIITEDGTKSKEIIEELSNSSDELHRNETIEKIELFNSNLINENSKYRRDNEKNNRIITDLNDKLQNQDIQLELEKEKIKDLNKMYISLLAEYNNYKDMFKLRNMSSIKENNESFNNNNIEIDKQFILYENNISPIVYIEIGNFEINIGLWNESLEIFEKCCTCPSYFVKLKDDVNISQNNLYEQFCNISKMSSDNYNNSVYELFLESGLFVGNDAYFHLFEYPDPFLRNLLEASPIMFKDKLISPLGLYYVITHCFLKKYGLYDDASNIQILFNFKVSFGYDDLSTLCELFFDNLGFYKVCFVNEINQLTYYLKSQPQLFFEQNFSQSSMLILDIGSNSTKVYPVYEGVTIKHAVQSSSIGGETCTEYLNYLLNGKMISNYSSIPLKRQILIARSLKEKYAFIASESFESYQNKYGRILFEKRKVIHSDNDDEDSMRNISDIEITTELTDSIQSKIDMNIPDGDNLNFTIDREKFYCSEVLFKPFLFENASNEEGIIGLIKGVVSSIDLSVRNEICSNIFITGKTALIPGFKERLTFELTDSKAMSSNGIYNFSIYSLESNENNNTCLWESANRRMKISLSSENGQDDDNNNNLKFNENEFILSSEYMEQGSSVIERLLDDCY